MYTKFIKPICTIVAVVLMMAAIPATFYAAEAIGSRIEIEKIDGTAYIVKPSGKKTEARAGVKLSAKESLQTAMGSYAFLGIDDDKVIKVDELSQINIVKKSNKLSVNIEEGSIMFEVKNKIPETCEMDLNASTMAMSIRGTAGVIGLRRIGDNIVSVAELVDGKVDMTYNDIAGKGRNFTLWGGESALHKDGADTVERDLIDITEFPGFAAVELADNPELCEKMLEKSGLNAKWPIEHAQELLERGQAHNRECYYDVFEPGNTHSVASLKGYVDSVMNLALDSDLTEPSPTPYPMPEEDTHETVVPVQTPVRTEPTPVDENLKKYGRPIATATPAPDGYSGPNTISWDEYANRNRKNENNGSDDRHNENNGGGITERVEPRPAPNYEYRDYGGVVNPSSSSSSYVNTQGTGGSSNNNSGPDPYGDDDDSSSSSSKKKTPTPTPTPEPTPTEEPTEEFLVRFFDSKADVPTQPIKEMYVKKGEYAVPPEDPVHEGFKFTGWDPDRVNEPIYKMTNFYAVYEEKKTPTVSLRVWDQVATLSPIDIDGTDDPYELIKEEDRVYRDVSNYVYAEDYNTIYISKESICSLLNYPDCYFRPCFSDTGYMFAPESDLEKALDEISEWYSKRGLEDVYEDIGFELIPHYRTHIIDSEGEYDNWAWYGVVIDLNASEKQGHKFSHWKVDPGYEVYWNDVKNCYQYRVKNHDVVIEAVYD
ncbi:MAG: FecR domain-containing protein [Lachnospiraceae bacterium]|nr:FecR domain-containing protein [Lachnospiraceae bacterium]